MRRKYIYTVLLIIITIIFAGMTAGAEESGESRVITAITLEGNEIIEDSKILPLVSIEVGEFLDEEKIRKDMNKIYELGYFQDVSVSFEIYEGGVKAIFELQEYPLINKIMIKGNKQVKDSVLMEKVEIPTGEVLNRKHLIASRKSIEQYYRDNDYLLAGLEDMNISNDGELTLKINEGYINDINIKGNEKTKDFIIERELGFSSGEVLNAAAIRDSFQKLVKLNLFKEVNPYLEPVSGEPFKRNIVIEVEEAKTGNFGAGITWSTKDGWLGSLNVKEKNLMGNGQTLGFQWEFGGAMNYSVNFHEPWLFGTPTSFNAGIYDRRSESSDTDKGDYEKHLRGGSISFGRSLTEEWEGKVRFKHEDSTIDWADKTLIDDEASVRSLTLEVGRDTTNNTVNPTDGSVDTFSVEYAGQFLGGDSNFNKYNLDLRRYYPGFKGEQAWAVRLKAGTSTGDLPDVENYQVGGGQTLRGYENGKYSGEDMLLMNLEYRFPITDTFSGVLFADSGQAWKEEQQVDLSDLKYSVGGGLRLNTAVGQIRLDYGFNEDGGSQPHFSIGHAF
ncbi:MAG: BamA/OMP85 family outer membrane protein [Halothermotrichaceae bacterium]